VNGWNVVVTFAIALAFSIGLIPLILRVSTVYGLFDHPDNTALAEKGRRIHSRPTPRLGGVAIVSAFFAAYVLSESGFNIPSVLLLSLLVFAVGAIDDVWTLSAQIRLALQFLTAALSVHFGHLYIETIFLTSASSLNLPAWLGFSLPVFIIVGAINALNMIDGLDGLAGGISVIALTMLALINYLATGQIDLFVFLTIPTIGAILGFLRYNTHPASIFMGDNGSNWLGYMIGVHILLVLKGWVPEGSELLIRSHPHAPIFSVLLCFAVPIFDAASVIIRRFWEGSHPMSADNRHLHHALMRIGLSQSQAVTFIYFISIAMAMAGIMPLAYPHYALDWVPLAALSFMIIMLWFSNWIRLTGVVANPFRTPILNKSRTHPRFRQFILQSLIIWERINKYCLFVILMVTPFLSGKISQAIGISAIPLAILTLGLFFYRRATNDFFESMIVTLSCIILLVANNHNSIKIEILGVVHNVQALYNGLFYFLFVSSLMLMLVTIKRRYFILTPGDFLMLAIPFSLILFPDALKAEYRLDIIGLKGLIFFLGYRTIERRSGTARRHLKLATLLALVYVVLVGVLDMRLVY
jgi:UDP-GlcNAc:undecaprenyl-phosphate GlcNAc-1-phosphate transferase